MKKRIQLSLVSIAILAVVTTAFSITLYYYDLFQTQVKDDLKSTAILLEHYDLNTYIKRIDDNSGIRITWISEDGSVLYDNDVSEENLSNHNDRPEVQDAFENGEGEAIRISDTLGMDTYYYAIKLDDDTVLRISKDTKSLTNIFIRSLPLIVTISILIVSICIFISNFLTKKLISPIEKTINHLDEPGIQPTYVELKPFVRKIKKQHDDILSAAKMRQDFSANISHELKTPLTVISGYAEIIENNMVDAQTQIEFSKKIRTNTNRMLKLIDDIIELSKLDSQQSFEFEEIQLDELVEESLVTLKTYALDNNITIEENLQPVIILGNKTLIEELVYNLVQNAIQYNVKNGKVKVQVDVKENVVLSVSDTGIGIPKSDQKHIFERFYRVDKSRSKKTGGTGLGLSIVKHIVEIHHAGILLESEENIGTTIKVIFK